MIYIIMWEKYVVKIEPKSLTVWNGMAVWRQILNSSRWTTIKLESPKLSF